MKKAILILTSVMFLGIVHHGTSQNLFPAGNLENGITGWVIKWNSGTAGKFEVTTDASEGKQAALIDVTTPNSDLTKVVLTGPAFSGIDDRSSYRISTTMKSNVAQNELRIQFVTKDAAGNNRFNNSPKDSKDEFFHLTTDYKVYKWIASTNRKGFGTSAEFRVNCAKYIAKYYIDDFRCEKITGLEDGGFEDPELTYGYTPNLNTTSGANAMLTRDDATVYQGTGALKVQVTAKSDTASHVNIVTNTRFYPEAGKDYDFIFYAKCAGTNDSVFACVNYYNGNNDFIIQQIKGFKLTNTFAPYKTTFKLPSDTLFSVKFRLDFGKQTGTIYVDELSAALSTTTQSPSIVKSALKCYPNPAGDQVSIEGLSRGETVELIGITGEILRKQVVSETRTILDLRGLIHGMYFVKSGKNSEKLIIQ